MSTPDGSFIWYDLATTDEPAAKSFYSTVIGWTAVPVPNMPYTLLQAGDRQVGGMMPMPPGLREAGGSPCWTGYIMVNDVDAAARKVAEAGGLVHRPPEDIPDVGRFAVVADPHGAVFNLFKPRSAEGGSPDEMGKPGHIGWRELHSGDMPSAFDFYAKLFGWKKTDAVDMGPMGIYQLFATGGEQSAGGMMTKSEQMPGRPRWLYYFNVDEIDAAAERTKAAGGQILNGPHQVPGGLWIAQALDPQGAMFAMLSQKRASTASTAG